MLKSYFTKSSATVLLSLCSLAVHSSSFASEHHVLGGELQTSAGQSLWVECLSYSAEGLCTDMKVLESYQNKQIINSSNDPFNKTDFPVLTETASDTYIQLLNSRLHNDTTTSAGDCDGATEGGNAAIYYSCIGIAKLADVVESPYSLSKYLVDRGENSAYESRFAEMLNFMTGAKNRGSLNTISDFDMISMNAGLKKSSSEAGN